MPHAKKDVNVVGRDMNKIQAADSYSDTKAESSHSPKKAAWKKWLLFVLFLILIIPLIIGVWDAINYSHASQKIFGSSNLLSALGSSSLKSSDSNSVNLMIVGYSADDPGHGGANLTDSIMIVSLSTVAQSGYMLSIPRDLYVAIPGFGRAKINEALQDGEASNFNEAGFPAGGMGLLEKTVFQSLGISTNYYALLDYAAVRDTTDALSGITVDIKSSDPRGIYDPNFKSEEGGPLRLANGQQKIDGLTALRLTRARGAAGGSYGLAQSDFDRTKNQQALLTGIKKAVSWGLLLNPLKNEKLLNAAANNIRTDIQIGDALPLFKLFHRISDSNMKSVTLRDINGQNLLRNYTTPYGQSALVPIEGMDDYSGIRAAINNLSQ